LAFARYADLLWWETSRPDLEQAREFARAIHREFPGKLLAYNCSPSFNWRANLEEADIARFQTELGAMGYKFQFVTLAGFHSLNHGMFELARGYRERGMTAYSELQRAEFASEAHGYSATRHHRLLRSAQRSGVRCRRSYGCNGGIDRSVAVPTQPAIGGGRMI
jgi:isocitrate lyase